MHAYWAGDAQRWCRKPGGITETCGASRGTPLLRGGRRTGRGGERASLDPGTGGNPVSVTSRKRQAGLKTPVHPGLKIFSKEQLPSAGLFGEEHKATLNRRGKEQDRHSTGSEEGQRDRQTQGGRKATLEGPHPSVHRCCGPGMQAVQMRPHPAVFQPHLEMAPRTEAVHPQPVCGSECPWAAVIASTSNG